MHLLLRPHPACADLASLNTEPPTSVFAAIGLYHFVPERATRGNHSPASKEIGGGDQQGQPQQEPKKLHIKIKAHTKLPPIKT